MEEDRHGKGARRSQVLSGQQRTRTIRGAEGRANLLTMILEVVLSE